jgi:hypothetical protein
MDAEAMLACWERGKRRHPLDRALLLFAAARPEADPHALADRTLGERNAALLRLRQRLFGDELKSCIDCPECGERLEFSLSAATLLERAPATHTWPAEVQCDGERLRLPTTRDLVSLIEEAQEFGVSSRLLNRLAIEGNFDNLADEREALLERALDEADPCMDFGVALTCPACTHAWTETFDVPGFLWQEVDARARRLLDDVHVLARAYGWNERQILALSDARRHAYLERVLA